MIVRLCATLFVISHSFSAELNSDCITPNGEDAKCISIQSCSVIKQSMAYLDPEALEFARMSQCGYNNAPLVCCGSKAGRIRTTPRATLLSTFHNNHPFVQVEGIPLTPLYDHYLPDHSLCGIQARQNDNGILGGNVSDICDFPWIAALKYAKNGGTEIKFSCGGSLISKNFVLTAAQCLNINGYNLIEVRLGEWRISTSTDCVQETELVCSDPVLDLKIVKQIPHPFYSTRSGNNDIALLKLDKEVTFTDFIRPICLPPPGLPEPKDGMLMHASGWGITEGKPSDYKLKVQIPVLSNEKCRDVSTNYTHKNPNQACVGGDDSENTCYGDPGGPVMTTFKRKDVLDDEQWYQEGIIYRRVSCGRKYVPTLYTRVSLYSGWIINTIHASS